MKLVPLDRFGPAPMHALLRYPGRTPDSSFVFTPEGIIEMADADPLSEVRLVLQTLGSTPIEDRLPILCAGSNASPPQVLAKLQQRDRRDDLDDRNVAFLLAEVPGIRAVFAAHIGTYGVVPATLDRAPGVTATFFVGFYTRGQLASLMASESNYVLSTMSSAASGARFIRSDARLAACNFFLSRKGVLVLDGEAIALVSYSQSEILTLLFEELGAQESLPPLADYLGSPRRLGPVLERAISRAGIWRPHQLDADPIEPSDLQPLGSIRAV